MLSPISFDSFEFHEKFKSIFILKNKNKIGLYQLDHTDKETSSLIEPIYDSFKQFEYISSLDRDYKTFNVYYFTKDGKICPVGINGTKFYED